MTAPDRIIPTQAAPTVATYTLTSDGNQLGPDVNVLSIVVRREVNRVPTATLIIRDGDVASQTFAVSESGTFAPGKQLDVAAGYRAENTLIFSGEITGQQLKVRDQRSLLIVTAKDPAYKLTVGRRSRYFTDRSDSDAWEEIVNAAGLSVDGEATDGVIPELTQHLSTDWDFILSRIEANGLVCIPSAGELSIKKPTVADPAVLKLEYGANLLSFDAELDVRDQFAETEATAWDAGEGEAVTEASAPAPAAGSPLHPTDELADAHGRNPQRLHHGGGVTVPELGNWANAAAQRSRLSRVRATAEFQGTDVASVGDTVELAGLGKVINGLAYVSGLRHEIADGQWRTVAQLGLSGEWFTERYPVSAPPAGGLLPAVNGLHVATVIQVHDDPAGEERILVKIPALQPEGEGNWARLATGLGGADAGLTFRPAVGDEVVIGFLDDDPRYPVILGGLHASGTPAPLPPTEDNDRTGYVSRGGNRIVIDDTEQSIVLETAAGDTLSLLGKDGSCELKDQHGNRITLSSSGIEIESSKKLTLKAATELAAEGLSVNIEASTTGELKAGATLTVKGAIVQIN